MKWPSYLEIKVTMAFNTQVYRNYLNYAYLVRRGQSRFET